MVRTLAICLGVWVAISIPTAIVLGQFIAAAWRLPGPPRLWTPERQGRGGPKLRGIPKLWTPERHRRAARSRELLALH
jgi:hypothetical protein